MNPITQYAIAAPLNAIICCSAIAFLINKWNVKTIVKVGIVFVIYAMLAFVMCAGGNSLFALDLSVFNYILFLFYMAGGICSCILIYVYFERHTLGVKAKSAKKGKK